MAEPLGFLLSFLLSFCQPAAAAPQERSASITPYTERVQKQFNFYPGGKVDVIANAAGSFKIIGWKKSSVLLEAEKIVYLASSEQAKLLSEQFPIQVRSGQTSATIRTSAPPLGAAKAEINATLYVPKDKTDLNIHLAKGDLVIGSVNGWVEATLEDGSLEAKSMEGYFSLLTKIGHLDIDMAGKRWTGLGFTAVTKRGNVTVRFPLEYSAAVQLKTEDGDISVRYPERLVDGEKVPFDVVTNKKARSLSAVLGEGGAPIRISTSAGNIQLTSTDAP